MRTWFALPSFLVCLVLVCGCSSESLPFAGGELEGREVPAPEDWTQVAKREIVQLETRPEDPYSVNIWVISQGPYLHIFAGGTRAEWVDHIDANADVRLKIGEEIYLLRAQRVLDADEFERFARGWKSKYGRRPWNEDVNDTYLFRLTAR